MNGKKRQQSGTNATTKINRFRQALEWLRAKLSDGVGHPFREIEATAIQEGISLAQLPRAKSGLGIKSYKRGRQWFWTLGAIPVVPLTQKQHYWLALRGIYPDTEEEAAARYAEARAALKEALAVPL